MRIFTVLIVLILAIGLQSCEKKEDKKPPVAAFNISPSSGPFTSTFNFDGSSTTDENDPTTSLQVRWDFDGDGIFDTEFTTAKTAEHKYEAADTYTVGMEAMNSEGWTDYEGMSLVVYSDSVAPVPSFFIDPDSASVATIFFFNATASTDQYTPQDELQYRWDWENDGLWDTPFMPDSTFFHKYEIIGVYRVMLEVRNNITVTDTTSRLIHVHEL